MTAHVKDISASGKLWVGHDANKISNTVFDALSQAKSSIQISAFSLGEQNTATQTFFKIIDQQLHAGRYVQFIVNNLNGKTIGKFSKKQLHSLQKFENFDLFNFKNTNKYGVLHAKIIVIDRTVALIGSPNISNSAMNHNYEIMLSIEGKDVAKISNLLDKLTSAIKRGDDL